MRINLFNVQMFKSFQILWLSYVTILKCAFFSPACQIDQGTPDLFKSRKIPEQEKDEMKNIVVWLELPFLIFHWLELKM